MQFKIKREINFMIELNNIIKKRIKQPIKIDEKTAILNSI